MKRIVICLLCVLPFLGGCAGSAPRHVRVAPLYADDPYWANFTPKPESAVVITEGDILREYRPIARIIVDSVGSDRRLTFARMKEEGAKLGADAVIQIKVSAQYEGQDVNSYTGQTYARNRHTLEGLAVIYEAAD